jgi:hypothetical protein
MQLLSHASAMNLETIELQAAADRAASGQTQPPYKPSLVLRLAGIEIRRDRGNVAHGGAMLLSGSPPRCSVSARLGTAQARIRVAHEVGHVSLGHFNPQALFAPPAGYRGHVHSRAHEADAQRYGIAFTMPLADLTDDLEAGARSLAYFVQIYDVPESELRKRLRELDLWRWVYDDRNHRAYIASGWWKLTRRPEYLRNLACRQGRPEPYCEHPGCHRRAVVVHHLCDVYGDVYGRERDEDLEGLCSDHHYEGHVSVVRSWTQ